MKQKRYSVSSGWTAWGFASAPETTGLGDVAAQASALLQYVSSLVDPFTWCFADRTEHRHFLLFRRCFAGAVGTVDQGDVVAEVERLLPHESSKRPGSRAGAVARAPAPFSGPRASTCQATGICARCDGWRRWRERPGVQHRPRPVAAGDRVPGAPAGTSSHVPRAKCARTGGTRTYACHSAPSLGQPLTVSPTRSWGPFH